MQQACCSVTGRKAAGLGRHCLVFGMPCRKLCYCIWAAAACAGRLDFSCIVAFHDKFAFPRMAGRRGCGGCGEYALLADQRPYLLGAAWAQSFWQDMRVRP